LKLDIYNIEQKISNWIKQLEISWMFSLRFVVDYNETTNEKSLLLRRIPEAQLSQLFRDANFL